MANTLLLAVTALGALAVLVLLWTPVQQVYWAISGRIDTAHTPVAAFSAPRPLLNFTTTQLPPESTVPPVAGYDVINATGAGTQQQGQGLAPPGTPDPALPAWMLEVAEADPSKQHALVDPAEPLAAVMHSEVYRAAAVPQKPKLGSGAVDPAKHLLTKELVAGVAADKLVMLTWANSHYVDFAMNWVEHAEAAGLRCFLVGAMDDALLEELVHRRVPAFAMQSGLSTGDFGWGSGEFFKMGREKIALVETVTAMGFDVLISDVDTVWMRDPLPFFAKYPDADILTSSDSLHATVTDEGLERFPEAGAAANIGVMVFRAAAHRLAEEWMRLLKERDDYWDQNAFNDLFRRGMDYAQQRPDRLFMGYDGQLLIGILPVSQFCSGHTLFVQRMPQRHRLRPYVAHATFQYSGTPGKRHRMREALIWNDPPEYFDPPGGLLSFSLDTSDELLQGAAPREHTLQLDGHKDGHFALVHSQLTQIRNAMAIAAALGRVLIMPELRCGLDRWWAPHAGTIPGSDLQLPFVCPMDHIFDLEVMSRELPESEFGPPIRWREYSFLDNPRLLQDVADDALLIDICKRHETEGCLDGAAPAVGSETQLHVKPGLSDQQYITLLKEFKDVKLLDFNTMVGAFGDFTDAQAAARFEKRTQLSSSLWCCSDAHPGHVWYDMWHDRIPHVDRHNRIFKGPWKPQFGP